MLKRATAIYLFAAAVVIAAQLVLSPFYRNVVDGGDIWHVMNWFMARLHYYHPGGAVL